MSAPHPHGDNKPLHDCTNLELVQELCFGDTRGWLFWGSRGEARSPTGETWHREELLDAVNDLYLGRAFSCGEH